MNAKTLLTTAAVLGLVITNASAGFGNSLTAATKDGQTKITWNGKVVWEGATTGQVTTRAKSENNVKIAAAWTADSVLWESTPGAAAKLK